MEKLTQEQKEQAMLEFRAGQERRVRVGRRIVLTIAILNIVMSVLSFFIDFNIISLIVQIALSIALIYGVTWVRYYLAIGFGLSGIGALYIAGLASVRFPLWAVLFFLAYAIFLFGTCVLLFTSKSVSEYMYAKKHG